jgi:hypothetical protein
MKSLGKVLRKGAQALTLGIGLMMPFYAGATDSSSFSQSGVEKKITRNSEQDKDNYEVDRRMVFPQDGYTEIHSVCAVPEGGYVFAGSTRDTWGSDSKNFAGKIDAEGNLDQEWSDKVNEIVGKKGRIYSVCSKGDLLAFTGYEVDESDDANLQLLVLYQNGDLKFKKTTGGDKFDIGKSVRFTADDKIVCAGYTSSFGLGGYSPWIVSYDLEGKEDVDLSKRTYGGEDRDSFRSIAFDLNQESIAVGKAYSFTEDPKAYATGFTKDLEKKWEITIGDEGDQTEFSSACFNPDTNTFMAVGRSRNGPKDDLFFAELNSSGDVLTSGTWGGDRSDFARSVCTTSKNTFMITGETESFGESGSFALELDKNGNEKQKFMFPDISLNSICQNSNKKEIILGGETHGDEFPILITLEKKQEISPRTSVGPYWTMY